MATTARKIQPVKPKELHSPIDRAPDIGADVLCLTCHHGHYDWEILQRVAGTGYATVWSYRDRQVIDNDVLQVIGWMNKPMPAKAEIKYLHDLMADESVDRSI